MGANSCYMDFRDPVSHGSHVAGIMSARNNCCGIIGIAYNSYNFASVRVCLYSFQCYNWAISAGLDWAISNGYSRQIVNMSLQNCSSDPTVQEYVQRALDAGILIVAAAGNTSLDCGSYTGVTYPGKYAGVVAVSGTTSADQFASGSRHGPEVDLSAPFSASSMVSNGNYATYSGTSMATAVVSAVAAMVWSRHTGWTASQVISAMEITAVPLGGSVPNQYFGYGRVSASAAVQYPSPPPVSVTINGPSLVPARRQCTWYAAAANGTEPYTYSWTVNGNPAGDGTDTLTITTPSSAFTIGVTATDANGLQASNSLSVSIGGPSCQV
jgi:subtilisin family serine protease